MTFERIFWLEDNLGCLQPYGELFDFFSIPSLLERTTFAFDFEMGYRIVGERNFDLYVLDADFPNISTDSRKTYLSTFLDQLRDGKAQEFYFNSNYKGPYGVVGDNFLDFYQRRLASIKGDKPVVIFSSSMAAPMAAFQLRIPFYSKGSSAKEIEEYVRMGENVYGKAIGIETWEHGAPEDFFRKYIV